MSSKKNIKATQVIKSVDAILSYHEEEPEAVVEEPVDEEPESEEEPVKTKKVSTKKKNGKKPVAVEPVQEKEEPVDVEENEPDVYDRVFNDVSEEILNIIQGLTKERVLSAVAFLKIKASLSSPDIKKNIRTIHERHFPTRSEAVVEKPIPAKPTKKPTKKSAKDSSVPKKPLTAYILFCNATRDEIKTENPDFKFVDITRELGSRWKGLTDDDKKVYNDLHDKDVERYQQEMEASGIQVEPKTQKKAVKTEKPQQEKTVEKPQKVERKPKEAKSSGNEPKRGMSSYIYFCKEMRPVVKAEIPDIASNEILKELGRRWQLLTDEDKKPYNAMASAGKVEKKVEVKSSKKAVVESDGEKSEEEELEDEE